MRPIVSLFLAVCGAMGFAVSDGVAQIRFDFHPTPRPTEIEAIAGEPFGVGRLSFELPPDMVPQPLGIEGIGLSEKNGRLFSTALDNPAARKLLQEILSSDTPLTTGGPVREQVGGILREILDRPPRCTLYFLFRGSDPLFHATIRRPISGCCSNGGSNTPKPPRDYSRSPIIHRWSNNM
jgi:hypothetical protein